MNWNRFAERKAYGYYNKPKRRKSSDALQRLVSSLPVGVWVDCPLHAHVSTIAAAIRRDLIKYRNKTDGMSSFDRQIKWGQVYRSSETANAPEQRAVRKATTQ